MPAPAIVKTIKMHLASSRRTYTVNVAKAEYERGGIALIGLERNGEQFATFTSWLPGIPEGEVAIKDYGENEGFKQQLVDQGVIELTGGVRFSGHAVFPLARVLV